ncbi:hypothetical protein BD310DRAFT_920158 [Dichomitus squalens]|uniref:Uncharacterized protein n=1 Tax=Dichomitus squalens TaxID=114155 RepID=A0A4Q9Q5P3_9APHY|nr:hypothetical protein BD310DRAFT_920158 [Dichomitus squalens]
MDPVRPSIHAPNASTFVLARRRPSVRSRLEPRALIAAQRAPGVFHVQAGAVSSSSGRDRSGPVLPSREESYPRRRTNNERTPVAKDANPIVLLPPWLTAARQSIFPGDDYGRRSIVHASRVFEREEGRAGHTARSPSSWRPPVMYHPRPLPPRHHCAQLTPSA